jgi:hypothetical protein
MLVFSQRMNFGSEGHKNGSNRKYKLIPERTKKIEEKIFCILEEK